jgi:ElaB/YqjD/DUF883 family membrane-anchored ribosome-binding protein
MESENIKRKAHSAIDQAANKAEELEQAARKNTAQARASAAEHGEALADGVHSTLKNAEGFVKNHPIATAGMAVAAAVLTTRLLKN